jgi:hypothetical protein
MGWVPVSPHGINPAAPLHTVRAMSVSGSTLYAAGYSSDSGTELWKAPVADERWTLVASIPTLQRPLTMALHAGALYVGGYDNTLHSMLVRISLADVPDIRVMPLPVGGIGVRSLLSMESYLFLTIGGRIWRTATPDVVEAWEEIAREIGTGRPHVHEIILARGLGGRRDPRRNCAGKPRGHRRSRHRGRGLARQRLWVEVGATRGGWLRQPQYGGRSRTGSVQRCLGRRSHLCQRVESPRRQYRLQTRRIRTLGANAIWSAPTGACAYQVDGVLWRPPVHRRRQQPQRRKSLLHDQRLRLGPRQG